MRTVKHLILDKKCHGRTIYGTLFFVSVKLNNRGIHTDRVGTNKVKMFDKLRIQSGINNLKLVEITLN